MNALIPPACIPSGATCPVSSAVTEISPGYSETGDLLMNAEFDWMERIPHTLHALKTA